MAYADKEKEKQYKKEFYNKQYDRIALVVPKGKKEEYKAAAEANGESLNGYINRLISEDIQNHKPI